MKKTNYRKWAFKFLIYIILLNLLVAYIVGFTPISNDQSIYNVNSKMLILSILINILFIAGIVLTILSVKNKEVKDYKYKVSVLGYPVFIIINPLCIMI